MAYVLPREKEIEILELAKQGFGVMEIVKLTRCCTKTINKVISRGRPLNDQEREEIYERDIPYLSPAEIQARAQMVFIQGLEALLKRTNNRQREEEHRKRDIERCFIAKKLF